MEEIQLLEEMLKKAVESKLIVSSQKNYYLLKYRKNEKTLAQIQEEIAKPSKRLKTQKREYPLVYDKYVLKTCLGRGGMGEVYESYNRDTWQRVALKKIRSSYLPKTEAYEKANKRFMRECSLQAKLEHPNIVKVYDYGTFNKEIFLVTQLIDGETLQELIEREKSNSKGYYDNVLPPLLDQMTKICEAVDCAHHNGIVHRDINPSNMMIDKDRVWIMDFGLAKRYDIDITKLTKSTELVGTPSYMSPEQWNNCEIGPATDIYSLGATIYYLITTQAPHPEEPMAAAYNIINEIPATPIESYRTTVSTDIARVVEKAMAYLPQNRYSNAKNMGQALSEALGKWNRKSSMFKKLRNYLKGK